MVDASEKGIPVESAKSSLTEAEVYKALSETMPGITPLVGQERARRELVSAITQAPSGTAIIVSEPLGFGKTALKNLVWEDLIKNGFSEDDIRRLNGLLFDPSRNIPLTLDWSPSGKDWRSPQPKVVFVEEFDIKFNSKTRLTENLSRITQSLGKEVPIMVLMGDYSLRNPDILAAINSPYKPISVSLDPVTPEFFLKAFKARLEQGLKREISEDQVKGLFEEGFLNLLFPQTQPPMSNMRAQEWILGTYIANTFDPQGQGTAQFSAETYRKVAEKIERGRVLHWQSDRYEAFHREVVALVHTLIRDKILNIQPLQPFTKEDLISMHALGNMHRSELEEVIQELTEGYEVIQTVGIPFKDEKDVRPEPYLPKQETVLEAVYGPVAKPSKTEDERNKRLETEKKLHSLYLDYLNRRDMNYDEYREEKNKLEANV